MAQTIPSAPDEFRLLIPIAKVDAEKRLVRGVATAEVLDAQGDVVDYESAKKAFGLWPGNIREMHQAKAVGRSTAIEFDDATKSITVESYISKGAPDTWEKCLDRTLSMYSIGVPKGAFTRVVEKIGDFVANRLFIQSLGELSLVDNGACPVASFALVKSVDGQLTDVQPKEPAMAIEKRTIPQADLDNAKDSDFAGPDRSYPILEPADVTAAASALGRASGGAPARAKIKARIIAIAAKKGDTFTAKLPKAWQSDKADEKALDPEVVKQGETGIDPEPWDIGRILSAINVLEEVLANEAWSANCAEAQGDAAEAATERAQVELLRQSIAYALEFLQSEYEEQFETAEAEGAEPIAMAATVTLAKAVGAIIAKIGRRNSAADLAKLQTMHDHTVALGATCATEKRATETVPPAAIPPAAPVPEPPTPSPSPVVEPAVQKVADTAPPVEDAPVIKALQTNIASATDALTKATTMLTEQQATIAAQAGSLATLEERLKVIEAQPMPGGPVTRGVPVLKTLGGEPAGTAPGSAPVPADPHADVLRAYDTLAKAAGTEAERLSVAQQKAAFLLTVSKSA